MRTRGVSTEQAAANEDETEVNKTDLERHDSKSKRGFKSREKSNEKSSKLEKLKKIISPKLILEKTQSAGGAKSTAGKHTSIQHNCDRCDIPNSNLLGCEFCDLWLCNSCENLNKNDLALLTASTNQTHWYCHECEPQVKYILAQSKAGIVEVAKSVAHSLQSIKKDQTQAKKSLDSVSTKVNHLQGLYENVIQKVETFSDSLKEINLGKGSVEKSLKEVTQLSKSFSAVVQNSENKIYP
ncbi:unnamed protein product, partial [Owenia fusiformis]